MTFCALQTAQKVMESISPADLEQLASLLDSDQLKQLAQMDPQVLMQQLKSVRPRLCPTLDIPPSVKHTSTCIQDIDPFPTFTYACFLRLFYACVQLADGGMGAMGGMGGLGGMGGGRKGRLPPLGGRLK
jgi:hypothetical protein